MKWETAIAQTSLKKRGQSQPSGARCVGQHLTQAEIHQPTFSLSMDASCTMFIGCESRNFTISAFVLS